MNKRCFKKIFLTRYLKPSKIEKEVTIMEDKIMTIINQITHEKRYEDANGLLISENIKLQPKVSITYFVPDNKKSGGVYKTISGNVRRIDEIEKYLLFTNKLKVYFYDIIFINELK